VSTAARSEIPAGLPPASELPRARQTTRWMARPARFLQALQKRHGDVFTIHLLQEDPWVVVGDPALVKHVLTAPPDVLHAGEPKQILEPLLGPESVLLNDGERHMRQRKLLLPPFHGTRVARYEATMRAVAAAEIDRWPAGVAAPAAPRMSAIALEVILRTVFGLGDEARLAPLREALGRLVEYLSVSARTALVALGDSARLADGRFAEFRAVLAQADEMVFAELARRRAEGKTEGVESEEGEGGDVLSTLLAARHDDGSPMSDRELRDELMSLLVAGHETTAASLSWALERLVRNPQALERTVAEAEDGGGPYTEAVIQETLRIRPVFMHLARRVKEPFPLRGYLIPEGVTIAVGIPLVHSHPTVYPDPEAFRPERFLERPPGTYTWIPFGGGIRRCVGARFALNEMGVVLSTLLSRAKVRAEDDEPELATRRVLVMAPSRGGRVVLEPR
jgi:cytochrome P450 family 135